MQILSADCYCQHLIAMEITIFCLFNVYGTVGPSDIDHKSFDLWGKLPTFMIMSIRNKSAQDIHPM